jgi:uncharacterized protein
LHKKNPIEAVKWYRKAAEQNDAGAQYGLGVCYFFGQGVPQDYAKAFEWFHKSAEQNFAQAQSNLGACYAKGKGVAKDEVEAVKWYHKAAEQNDGQAQYNLGYCYAKGEGVTKDYVEAYKWFDLASSQDVADAKHNLVIIESWMAPEQIGKAQRLVREFKPRKAPELNAPVSRKDVFSSSPAQNIQH